MDAGSHSGGILELSELTNGEHRIRVVRDFRERFHLSVAEIGLSVRYDEAWLLVKSLSSDPTSWLYAGMAGWKHPLSREALCDVLGVTIFDLFEHKKAAKHAPDAYPRPWPEQKQGKKAGVPRPATEILALLRPNV